MVGSVVTLHQHFGNSFGHPHYIGGIDRLVGGNHHKPLDFGVESGPHQVGPMFGANNFGLIETAEKAAEIYLKAAALGPVERRLDSEQLTALARRFGVELDPEREVTSSVGSKEAVFHAPLAWIDPEEELLFVFLSNRIHPSQGNTLLIEDNVRTRIQQVLYDALLD